MPHEQTVRSVRTGGTDVLLVPTPEEAQREALLRERAGYLQRGLADRAAQVEEQLRLLFGWEPEPAAAEPPAPAARKPARKRGGG